MQWGHVFERHTHPHGPQFVTIVVQSYDSAGGFDSDVFGSREHRSHLDQGARFNKLVKFETHADRTNIVYMARPAEVWVALGTSPNKGVHRGEFETGTSPVLAWFVGMI